MQRQVAFIHTAHGAIPPLMAYYTAAAPEYDITNLLDEGILRFFASGNYRAAEWRFRDLISVARHGYRAEAAVITCSSAPMELVEELRAQSEIPLLKIDAPMAARAVRIAKRIGLALTFAATLKPSTGLLMRAAKEAGAEIEVVPELIESAYDALLSGHPEEHDNLVLGAVDRIERKGSVDAVVLAQVSMARVLPRIHGDYAVPILSSIETSLPALRALLAPVLAA